MVKRQPCCTLNLLIRALFFSIVILVTNYVTWMLSGGLSRMRGTVVTALEGHGLKQKPKKNNPTVISVQKTSENFSPVALPEASSAYADFCTEPSPVEDAEEELAKSVNEAQWDSIADWPASSLGKLVEHACHLTTLDQEKELGFLPVHICTHDPALDQVMAASFHSYKWWGANLDHRFILGGGYASGTPLRPLEAGILKVASEHARAKGKPYESMESLLKAVALPPVTPQDNVRSMCSRERPFVLDIGGNIGYYTLVAASQGCSVITVEPLSANVGRLWQSVVANRFEGQVTLYKNAVGKDKRLVKLTLNRGNPGASSVSDGNAEIPEGGKARAGGGLEEGGDSETVATVVLNELFDGSPLRPKHPFTGKPISPLDIAVIKVDVEGFDAAALWSMRGAIEVGLPPMIKVEYSVGDVKGISGCDNQKLIEWLYDLGYQGRVMGKKEPLTLKQWKKTIIPLLLEGKMEELHKTHDIPVVRELYMMLKGVDDTGLKGLFGD